MTRLLCMRLGTGQPGAQPSLPAYCETGRPVLRRTCGLASATFRLPLILGPRALDCLPLEVGRLIRAAAGDKTHPRKSEPLRPQPDPIVREWRYATDPLSGSKSTW